MDNLCKLTFLIFFSVFNCQVLQGQAIAINEIMASNATTLADEDGTYADWIELYNYGTEDINLEGWSISDSYDNPLKWNFPDTIIQAQSYLLLWASGKNRTEGSLHTNFSIRSNGEELILTDNEGNRVDEVSPVLLPTDISYGRFPNGVGNFKYYIQPTAALPNHDNGFDELVTPPLFSHNPGFYTDSFYVKIYHIDPNVEIRFTLDGSVPTAGSEIFPDSLLIRNRKNDPNQLSDIPTTPVSAPEWYSWFAPLDTVFKGTNIRAKAFKAGSLSPYTETITYWVDPDIHTRYSLPVVSLSMNPDDLLGNRGIYTNYNQRGPNWERDLHMAFFEPDGSVGFATDAGVRLHGGNSRRYALKSFRIYFRNEYGDSHIDYPVFPDQQINTHDRLILRNGGSDWAYTYFRDAFAQSILNGFTEVDHQEYRPSVVFLNGEYWGIMNIRERLDNKYIENYYDYTEIDMLESTGQLIYGSKMHYENLISFLHNNNLNESENYEWVQTQMDVDNFRDYHILQIFSMNTDQPGKNVRFWRPQTENGKWKWMWWDMDDTFLFGPHNNHDRNGLIYCTGLNNISATQINPKTPPPSWAPNGPAQTFPLRALLESNEFRHDFINRFADLLNTAFQPQYLFEIIDNFHATTAPHQYEHYRRWHRPEPEIYNQHLQHLYDFSEHRFHYMRQHIEEFFELDGNYQLTLDVASGQGHIRINTLHLTPELPALNNPVYPWTGKYFKGLPIEIEAVPAPGYVFSHWGEITDIQNPLSLTNDQDQLKLTAHFLPEAPDERELISFWYFSSDLPNDEPLTQISPHYSLHDETLLTFQSAIDGYPFNPQHDLWRKASMERRNAPTPINYHPHGNDSLPYASTQMRGIQIKQPFRSDTGENQIILYLPTTGFENIDFSFAVKDENAAQFIGIDYSIDSQTLNWINQDLQSTTHELENEYTLCEVDFSHIDETANNPSFAIRLRFGGEDMHADDGNRVTFNNLALKGNLSDVNTVPEPTAECRFLVYPNPANGNFLNLPNKMNINLFDLQGRLLQRIENTQKLNISNLPPGIYLLQNDQGEWAKMVVQ